MVTEGEVPPSAGPYELGQDTSLPPLLTRMTLSWTVRTIVVFREDSDRAMDHFARHYAQRSPANSWPISGSMQTLG
ncbi:hypothetical protein GCM10011410_07640 [Hoyosella rhizosphaerae]|uniref:Uncharacterized protein n=1 Tax=Hoyosella rhizosphaerae TaxID=1755582 RepID=A0A916U2G0_9ACTN|nr:hypothetical protein GCM10011410_07640 [Hoyosella rhizosphaerae]